jgi:hypothetical protein
MSNVKLEDIPDFGDHMTMDEWVDCCKSRFFLDSDGTAYYATETKETNICVRPSDAVDGPLDIRWTHIMWYNV